MIVNVCYKPDLTNLMTAIDSFIKVNNKDPYLFMNMDTANSFDQNCSIQKTHRKDMIFCFCGYKTFIDASLKFGEIELR